jgi:membrane-associated phospholipid phosphatase
MTTSIMLVITCVYFLDVRIALSVNRFLWSHPDLKKAVTGIPNVLQVLVWVGSASLCLAYLTLQKQGSSRQTQFLRLAMVVVPISYLSKMFLQYAFGRTNIQTWLSSGKTLEFAWFVPLSQYPCFPSGHMTVFTSFFATIWLYYPFCRPLATITLTVLASALVITNHHFPGDVIGGFVCGILVTVTARRLLSKCHI